uniref:putative B3 domain-containing protein At3g24850 n=1 Tax=Erigeron canadensis TaxID=72917 RepID=UPI001CB91AEF|nr:putative B3 domain-containing protein At3g24850 [Erigeron canadensis]
MIPKKPNRNHPHFEDKKKGEAYYMKKIEKLANGKLELFKVFLNLEKFISDELNGSKLKLVIQGYLTANDLKRLYMPFKMVKNHDFLTAVEKQIVNKPKVNQDCPNMGFTVPVLGPKLELYEKTIDLKTIWDTPKTPNYVLTTNWCNFVKENESIFKEGAEILVCSFRMEGKLCFAVTSMGSY